MSAHAPILAALDFIEHHLHAPITVAAMADAAGYSLYHFCRLFGKTTRHSPYDYLMRRRMTLAANDVIAGERKIVDIALDYQFESHEGFTRAFGRMFGLAPLEARKQACVPALRRLPRLTALHLIALERQHGLIPTFETLPEIGPVGAPLARSAFTQGAVGPGWTWIDGPQWWPPDNHAGVNQLPPDSGALAGSCARFALDAAPDALPAILDWVLHVWLFFVPYELRLPGLLLQVSASDQFTLWLPVRAAPPVGR